jgi:Ca2+-binding RTX toxin-like protein
MTIRNVGKNAPYATIAAADAAAEEGDIIRMAAGYTYERAVLTVDNLTVTGGAALLRIDLELGAGVNNVTLDGLASIWVEDNAGSNVITGNGGSNQVQVSGGADVVHGGDGHDALYVDYSGLTSVVATGGSVTDGGANSVTFDGFEQVIISTGSGDDSLTTDDGDHWINSGRGNDTIAVGGGRNFVEAGGGNDTVTAGDGGNMVVVNEGEDQGDDTVTTGDGDDFVQSGAGDDSLQTGGGDDQVVINGGIDTADGGVGHDVLFVNYYRVRTDVTVSITAGSEAKGYSGLMADVVGENSVSFTGFEDFYINAGRRDDHVRVGGGYDSVWGGEGEDFLHGGAGNDDLYGDSGADRLIGGQGEDILNSGPGKDTLIGGQGADVFLFLRYDSSPGGSDLIHDLNVVDTIDLSLLDADLTVTGDQAFVFVDRFSGRAGEAIMRYHVATNVSRLACDSNGDGAADIAILAIGDQRGFDNFVL